MSQNLGFLGVFTDLNSSRVALLPVPWEVTTSYGGGTALGPEAIFDASPQLDLFDDDVKDAYKQGYHWLPVKSEIVDLGRSVKPDSTENLTEKQTTEINQACQKMVDWVYSETKNLLLQKKIPAVVGGDHSVSLGIIKSLSEHYEGQFGVLHFDAHMDLRKAYQGLTYSHASIMRNVMELEKPPQKLVQVGIRDYCEEEADYAASNSAVVEYLDRDLKKQMFDGENWTSLCREIVNQLPQQVYISFDIDGLSPEFCPGTGTPVPGGLSFDQAVHLLSVLGESGRTVIGFDLVEVAPQGESQWDGNVGARLLQKMCGWSVISHG
ncbi:MAG: agmatinase [Pseudobdellovibrionaceae bacterium]|nr:agmatinase [Bdellovibrionales bacterium]USN47159.1 MAG: agmatinase [Pseudobdellovibrionaceae bacterium]